MRIEKLTASPPPLSYKKICVVRSCLSEYDYYRFEKMKREIQAETPEKRVTESGLIHKILICFLDSYSKCRSEESNEIVAQVIH